MAATPRKSPRRREPPVLSGEDELDEAIQQAAMENAEQEVEAATKKRGRGRPRIHPEKPPSAPKTTKADWTDFLDPVSITFLANVFRMDAKTVKRRIRYLDPVSETRGNPTYDFVEACGYLVEPQFNISDHIKGMRPQDLPPTLQQAFWFAQKAKMEVMASARQTWKTDAVSEAAGMIMKSCREIMLHLPDLAKDQVGLSDDQHAKMVKIIRGSLETMQQDVRQNALTRLLMGPEVRELEDAEREDRFEIASVQSRHDPYADED